MGFQSQSGHVGIKTQTGKGVEVTDMTTAMFFRTKSGAMGGSRELLTPDPEIGGGRDISDSLLGPVAFKGSYDFYARMEMIGLLFWGALGVKGAATSGGVTTHTVTPTDSSLPWFSVEERIGDGYQAFKYTDVKVSTLHLEAEANGYLQGTVELIGLRQRSIGGSYTPLGSRDYDTTPMEVGSNIIVAFAGNTLPAKSFSLDINNNLEDDDFRLGSLFLGDLVEKRREIMAGVTIRPEDGVLWRQAVYGDPAATTPQGTIVKGTTHILAQTYETIPSSSPPTYYSLDIAVPVAVIAPFEVSPSGDDVLQHDIEIHFLRPDPAVDIMAVTLKNGLAAIP